MCCGGYGGVLLQVRGKLRPGVYHLARQNTEKFAGSATPGMEYAQLAERAVRRDAIEDERKVLAKVF